MRLTETLGATLLSILLVLSLVSMGAVLGTGIADAKHPDDAPDMTEYANFRTDFPAKTDHYPGDVNEENGSILYSASGAEAFERQDAQEGVFIDWIIVHAEYEGEDWIDYSACDTPNTAAFGIDRGDNDSGYQYDQDLVSKQKDSNFLDNGITINFYNWNDFGGDPPYMAPEDAIVAAQGAGSDDGPCLTLTEEPGWYRIAAYMNGTVADNGPDERPSEDAKRASLELNANYMYVCECDSRSEAEEQLGRAPDDPEGDSTPTATPSGETTPTPTDAGGEATPTPTESGGGPTPTPGGGATPTAEQGNTDGGGGGGGNQGGSGNTTPTLGDGPGFTGLTALLALLASALLVHRRR